VTAADRPCGEFYDFYSVSPENFGYHLVYMEIAHRKILKCSKKFRQMSRPDHL